MKDNKKTSNHKDNKKKAEPVEKKVIGPKILKPSPARLKKQQPEATKELVQVTIPEAPKEEKRGNNRGRNMGKPGRKGKINLAMVVVTIQIVQRESGVRIKTSTRAKAKENTY